MGWDKGREEVLQTDWLFTLELRACPSGMDRLDTLFHFLLPGPLS